MKSSIIVVARPDQGEVTDPEAWGKAATNQVDRDEGGGEMISFSQGGLCSPSALSSRYNLTAVGDAYLKICLRNLYVTSG